VVPVECFIALLRHLGQHALTRSVLGDPGGPVIIDTELESQLFADHGFMRK
jgi:hypothetical protein